MAVIEPPNQSMRHCTCDVRRPRRHDAYARTLGGYVVYLSQIEDATRFDPACPFHGERGSMLAVERLHKTAR